MNTQETKQNFNNTDFVLIGTALDLLYNARDLYAEYLKRKGIEYVHDEIYQKILIAASSIYKEWEQQNAIKQQQSVA